MICCFLTPAVGAAPISDFRFPFTFKIRSEFYTLESWHQAKTPGFAVFQVKTPHGSYEPKTLPELAKTLREIEVLEKIRLRESGSSFAGGAVDSFVSTGEGLKDLVISPVQSVRNMGAAVGKAGRSIGGIFRTKEEAEKTSFSETVFGSAERDLARELNVDVYTRNPVLKKKLESMARSRTGGKGLVLLGELLIPVALLVSAAVSVGNINSVADEFVNNHSRADLYRANQLALEKIGFLNRDIPVFLNKPFYTPREITYLRVYLERLQGVEGTWSLFQKILNISSEDESRAILYSAELAAESVSRTSGNAKMQIYEEGILLEDDERILFLAPFDYLRLEDALSAAILKRLEIAKRKKPQKQSSLYLAGQPSMDFVRQAEKQDVEVRGWMLFRTLEV